MTASRIRRVKCDEAKPWCTRCTTTGRQCDGYAERDAHVSKLAYPIALSQTLPLHQHSTLLEKRAFHFFRCQTVPSISGYFQDDVWGRLVLQLSHVEPAVRHAVNALGALHEEQHLRCTGHDDMRYRSTTLDSFSTQQYANALERVQTLTASSRPLTEVVVVCALVCIHFEALRGNSQAALLHIENAIKILVASKTLLSHEIDSDLVCAMMRVDLQSSMYLGSRVPGLPFFTISIDAILPATFTSVAHARSLVDTWGCRQLYFIRSVADKYKFLQPGDVPLEVIGQSHELAKVFNKLDRLLSDFIQRTSCITPPERCGLDILSGRVKTMRTMVATCLYSEETAYDAHFDDFCQIYSICEGVVASGNAGHCLWSVSLDEGLLHPLYCIATSCRDGLLRHKALTQLQELPGAEGIWHVQAITYLAMRCVEFEERFCGQDLPRCDDIPEWKRIHSAGFRSLGHSLLPRITAFIRTRPNGMDGEWQDDEWTITW